ncbi:MAG: DUF126 domain-containing protein [Pyrodictiaceae archaeon]
MRLRLRGLVEGEAEAQLLVYNAPLSLYGELDEMGRIHGKLSISGRIFVFRYPRGSTVGSYILYGLARKGYAPRAIVVEKADPILVAGSVLAEIPLAEGMPGTFFKEIERYNGRNSRLKVNPPEAILEIEE